MHKKQKFNMKHFFLTLSILVLTLASCSNDGYTITGKIEGQKAGKAVLMKIKNGRPFPIDTIKISDGSFTFKGKVEEPELFLISIDKTKNPIGFFVENKNININVDVKKIEDAVIEGSPITDEFKKLIDNTPGNDRLEKLSQEVRNAQISNNKDALKSIQDEYNNIMAEQQAYFKDYINKNNDKIIGVYMALRMHPNFKIDELKELEKKFEKNLGQNKYVKEFKSLVEAKEKVEASLKATEIGAVAPDFTLPDLKGKMVDLKSFDKKSYLLLDFWASWCHPCINEIPNLKKAYKEFSNKGFNIISISLDKNNKAWSKALNEHNMTWTQLNDSIGDVASTYGVTAIPFTLLLDKDGKIVAKNLRGEQLENKLKELLK